MKKIYLSVIILFALGSADAQLPILYYDFENNVSRTTPENAVEQAINTGSGPLTLALITGGGGVAGAGSFNGGGAVGQAITATNWSSSITDPGTGAANYYQFVLNSNGFSDLSLTFDCQASSSGPARVGVLYSTNGTTFTAITTGIVTSATWSSNSQTFSLPASTNNQSSVTIRIYAFAGSASDRATAPAHGTFATGGTFRVDNLSVLANTITGSKTLLDYPAIGLSIRSGTAFTPSYSSFTVDGSASATAASAINFSGSLSVDGTFACGTNVISGAGSVVVGSTGTLKVGSLNPSGAINGNITAAGGLTLNAGSTVEFNGSGNQKAASRTFSNIIFNNASGVTLIGDLAVSTRLFLQDGLLDLSTFNFNVAALALVQRSEGSISGTPNYAGYTNFLYTNTTLITIHPELPSTANLVRDLTMNGAGGITLANPVSLYGTLTLTNGIINTTNTNFLYLGRNDLGGGLLGAVSGGNGSSYVFGPVHRDYEDNLMTTGKIYPVGSQGRYRPIMINISHNNVAPTVYRVTIIEPNDLWDVGNLGNIKTVSQQRRYSLDRIDVGASAINNREVTMWWNDDDMVVDWSTLAMGKLDIGGGSNKWGSMNANETHEPIVDPNPVGGGLLGWVYGELNPNDVFFYALVSESFDNPLPVSLFSFSGKKDNNANILSWSTASESNSRGFEIQRSSDGINYTSIGFVNSVAASGFSSTVLNYSYADYTANAAKSYYRLRFVDLDNRSKFSNILVIKGEKPVTLTIDGLFPNPASAQINMLIATPDKDRVTILLSDMAGRTLLQKVVSVETGSNSIPLDISKLTNGTYIVRLICEKGCEKAITTFVKQ